MNEQTFIHYLYEHCYQKSIDGLSQKAPEKQALIEDCVQEAIIHVWFLEEEGKLKHKSNLCGLVYRVARNIWLKQVNKTNKTEELDERISEALTEEMYDEIELCSKEAIRMQAMKNAFESLGKKCKRLLKRFLVDETRLKSLVDELGYGSYNSIKSSKSQCARQLEQRFAPELDKLR